MKFTVADLERHAIDFDESLVPGSIDFVEDIRQVAALHTSGHVDLLHENRGSGDIVRDIRIRAAPRYPHRGPLCPLPGAG